MGANEIPVTVAAYAAGIMDGEGCFYISSRKGRGRDSAEYEHFQAHLQVINTDRAMMDWLAKWFGGSVKVEKARSERHQPTIRWQIGADLALRMVRAIRPFLVAKGEQADLIESFWSERGPGEYWPRPIPASVTANRLACRNRLMELHGIGRSGARI